MLCQWVWVCLVGTLPCFPVSETGVSPPPPRQGFGLSQYAPYQNIPQGLDLLPWGLMQQRALLCILGTLGTGEAWPCLATDLKKPIHRTNIFCGCALLLKLVRREAQASGFCTLLVHQWKHHLEVPPGQYRVSHTCLGQRGLWWRTVVQGGSWEAPGVLRCVKTAPLNLPFVSLCRIVVLFESSCSKRSLQRRKPFPFWASFFPLAECLLSLLPGISLPWLDVLKDYTLHLKTSWVTPL